ncbi:MAG TPA: Atrophin-1 multi-domain protein [Limnobacter sp.]|nr:Atrophin-1 multi-domain protein [Limnobacter sp.]
MQHSTSLPYAFFHKPKRLPWAVCLCLGLQTWSVQANVNVAQALPPVCQVSVSSGYCQVIGDDAVVTLMPSPVAPPFALPAFESFERPFATTSLWNSRPQRVVFGTTVIPESSYFPKVGPGNYSTSAFLAQPGDSAMVVYGPADRPGIWNPDAEAHVASITVPRWPADVLPATGTDGHADIVDTEQGVIHSFFQLKKSTDGRWTATQYAWTKLNGRGWGDGAHYFQGARAAAVPSMAGLIRQHEINDGASQYYHALAMSLTFNGMSNTEQYVFPATSGDTSYIKNSGEIPTGALLMLPPSFDASSIENAALRKVVNTLKTYGAYVVDRNVGTPFYIYVDNGADFNLHEGGWNSRVASDLQRIRAALREVVAADGWVDGHGRAIASQAPLNILSMRGPWRNVRSSSVLPVFNTLAQSVEFGATVKQEWAENASGRVFSGVQWARPVKGKQYEFRVESTNGGRAYLRFWGGGAEQFNTRALGNGESFRFFWPMVDGIPILGAVSGIGEGTRVRAQLVPVE